VARTGKSTRITYGILNLTQRDSAETPSELGSPGSTVLEARDTPPKVHDWDVATGILTETNEQALRRVKFNATGTELASSARDVLRIRADAPVDATLDAHRMLGFARGPWKVRAETSLRMTLTKNEFRLTCEVRALENNEEVFSRQWHPVIRRDLL